MVYQGLSIPLPCACPSTLSCPRPPPLPCSCPLCPHLHKMLHPLLPSGSCSLTHQVFFLNILLTRPLTYINPPLVIISMF